MTKRILITGSLGHIGSKLIHSLTGSDYSQVTMIDNLSTQRFSSLFNLPSDVNFHYHQEDILDADLNKLFKDIDVVIHLAALTDAATSFEREDEVEAVNYQGTLKVISACEANKCKLLFPSTTSVYGSQKKEVDENCSKEDLLPQSPYAETKLMSEQKIIEAVINNRLKAVILRLGTIFGSSKGMRFHTAVNKFCWQATLGESLSVWSTALDQKRPYLGLNDAVNVIKFFIEKNIFNGEIFNVVTSNCTVKEVVSCIQKYIKEVKIDFVDTEIMNQLSYEVSSKKVESLGYKFSDDLEEGIKETIHLLGAIKNSEI
tara:strand:+ start:372 stop:1319 length:948 start_codon:yes stop_codon:yes gene_type:complete